MQSPDLPISTRVAFPPGMQVFERGWLSSNCILFADDTGATLVDSGYCTHAEQTFAMLRHALDRHETPELRRLVNTHLHSDHCGGNRMIAKRMVCDVVVPIGCADAVRRWDQALLSFEATGQPCERFEVHDTLSAGDFLTLADKEWEAVAAPGHDRDALMFHCAEDGILISGDALWEDGCGAIFPTDDPATTARDFAGAFATLDLIERLAPRVVVPGHGRPFDDAAGAVARARSRLHHLSADLARNSRHVVRVLLKYRLLDLRRIRIADVEAMFADVPTMRYANREFGLAPEDLARRTIDDLVRVGVARFENDILYDA